MKCDIIYLSIPKLKRYNSEVWVLTSNFILHFIMDVVTYLYGYELIEAECDAYMRQ